MPLKYDILSYFPSRIGSVGSEKEGASGGKQEKALLESWLLPLNPRLSRLPPMLGNTGDQGISATIFED